MSNSKRALSSSANRSRETVKPTPPPDLWQQLDKACEESGMRRIITQPPNTFTAQQWAEKSGIAYSMAKARMLKLSRLGKIEKVGVGEFGVFFYRMK